jgi:hypothetical protein
LALGDLLMPRIPLEWIDTEICPTHQLHLITCKPFKKTKQMIAVESLGPKCVHCGYDENIRVLEIDHIYGDGNIERKAFKQGEVHELIHLACKYNITEALKIVRSRYQVLCCRCNKLKAVKDYESEHNIALQLSNMGCVQHVRIMRNIIMNHIRGLSNVL